MRPGLFLASTLWAASLLTSCSGSPTPPSAEAEKQPTQSAGSEGQGYKDNTITLDYSNEIEGYRVRVYWKPVRIKYSYVIGPAILEFSNAKDSTSFTLTNNHFSVLKSTLHFAYNEDSTEIKGFNERSLKMPYKNTPLDSKGGGFDATSAPFFFADIDFDHTKELLIKEADHGQRGVATFKAYQFDDGYNAPEPSELGTEPFSSLDELSVIDYANKSIVIENSNGACSSSEDTYKLRVAKNEDEATLLVLDSITEGQMDEATSKCYELKYKIVNNQKKLISKTEVKS